MRRAPDAAISIYCTVMIFVLCSLKFQMKEIRDSVQRCEAAHGKDKNGRSLEQSFNTFTNTLDLRLWAFGRSSRSRTIGDEVGDGAGGRFSPSTCRHCGSDRRRRSTRRAKYLQVPQRLKVRWIFPFYNACILKRRKYLSQSYTEVEIKAVFLDTDPNY